MSTRDEQDNMIEVIEFEYIPELDAALRLGGAVRWISVFQIAHLAVYIERGANFETTIVHCGGDTTIGIQLADVFEAVALGGYDWQARFCPTCADAWRRGE
jgi:hypothetical protein